MVTTRSISLAIPDFKTMSDDDVEAHLLARHRDGRWSTQTRWLLSAFGTEKLELNEAWAENWTDWTCPACGRAKIELARLTEQNVLLCQLDWHHDHLRDHASRLMRAQLTGDPGENERRAARSISAALPLIERFSETLLCNDCNAADAAMKAQLGKQVPSYFSFRPSEITRFVVVEPNRTHGLDVAAGEEIWDEVSADLAQRTEFAEMLGTRIGQGQHEREEASFALRQSTDDRKLFFALGYEAMSGRAKIDGIAAGLIARSRSTAGRWSATKLKVPRKLQAPDQATFERLDAARNSSSRWWRESGEAWRCPCCARTKFEIVRKSNKGDWTALIMAVNDFHAEADSLSLSRRGLYHPGPIVLASHYQIGVCQDCRHILSDALTIRPGNVDECLSLAQLRGLIEGPAPHTRHALSPELIGLYIDANTDWTAGVADYWSHHRHASDISLEHYRIMQSTGLSAAGARDIAIVKLVAAQKLPADGAAGWFDWFMLEDKRMRAAPTRAGAST